MTISELSDLIAYEIYDLVTYIRVYEDDKPATTCVIIHNETGLCTFINVFGDAEIDAVEGDVNCVIANIHFNHLSKDDLLTKVNEYNHKVYL